MFEDYFDSQKIAYSLISNSFDKGRIFHAYLINGNNYDKSFDFTLALAKKIICYNRNLTNDEILTINKRIDDGNYPELKIIESDSLVIKKEQLLELQSEFSKSSIEGNYRIYIIKDCDKMNKQASNSLLKFLEEPVSGIVAILLTNHFSNILSTIVSRCQVINLVNDFQLSNVNTIDNFAAVCCDNIKEREDFINNSINKDIINDVISFLLYSEDNGLDTLVFIKDMWYNKFKARDDSLNALLLMVYFYYDVLKSKLKMNNYFFCDRVNDIERIANNNSIENIIHKIDVVNYGYDMVKCNLNVNLLIDDIVIRLGE